MPCSYDEPCPAGSVQPGNPCPALYERNDKVGKFLFYDINGHRCFSRSTLCGTIINLNYKITVMEPVR